MTDKWNITFGIHAVESLLRHSPHRIVRLAVLETRQDAKLLGLIDLARKHGIRIELYSKPALQAMTPENHQGIIAFCKKEKQYTEADIEGILDAPSEPPFCLVLDGVQDPHNLGACLRSAAAAGVHCVIIPKDRSVGLTPTVLKVASGAAETIPLIPVTNLARTLRSLKEKGIWIVGMAGEAEQRAYEVDLTLPIAIVLGAEEKGLRRLTREHCDFLVSLPMVAHSVASLNVSVATGIVLFEAVRQRMTSKE